MSYRKPLPSKETLHSLMVYDAASGLLYWKARSREMFAEGKRQVEATVKLWNAKYAGKPAFTATNYGYKYGQVLGSLYHAHRVIWKMINGDEPYEIDHKNRDKSDNRIDNLRAVENWQNALNRFPAVNNTSGHRGVSKTAEGNWRAYITHKRKRKVLGTFSDLTKAVAVREAATLALWPDL